MPVLMMLALAAGIWIGMRFFAAPDASGRVGSLPPTGQGKQLSEILYYIDAFYVDSVDTDSLMQHTIETLLSQLDPHTAYIPAKDLEVVSADLQGNFEGIGVEFSLVRDTIFVVAPIINGPSESVGIRAGDKIITVEDKTVAGVGITNREVIDLLRGRKGTEVRVGVQRGRNSELLPFTITRDQIPTYTVTTAFKLDQQTGYIKLSRFAANTYEEFLAALQSLKAEGITNLILDMRGNPGGYMSRAIEIADEFLAGNALIVYTDGKLDQFDSQEHAKKEGLFEEGALIVLIDEGSASAAEIVAGALQDNDRALIVGRRSFGKGLVQKPIGLSDRSQLRLTISRYYTPSGRSIQKPYDTETDYESEILERYFNGEYFALDSTKLDLEHRYQTRGGRTVFGGGGIVPDYFVPRDTSYFSPLLDALVRENLFREFAASYVRDYGEAWADKTAVAFVEQFSIDPKIEADFWALAQSRNIPRNPTHEARSGAYIKNLLKAFIARLIWQEEGFYRVYLQTDEAVKAALQERPAAEQLLQRYK